MKRLILWGTLILSSPLQVVAAQVTDVIKLPEAEQKGGTSLEQALKARRSVREFSNSPLELKQIAQLAWAAQGVTNRQGFRTAPSAGGLYPLELYLVAGRVNGLEPGIYRYLPDRHALQLYARGDYLRELAGAGYNQGPLREAAAVFAITGIKERTARKYGPRAERYVLIEAGHAGQNLLLQATVMGLGSVIVGAFHDPSLHELLRLSKGELAITLIPVGIPD